jgi:hypothetical protein
MMGRVTAEPLDATVLIKPLQMPAKQSSRTVTRLISSFTGNRSTQGPCQRTTLKIPKVLSTVRIGRASPKQV